MLLYIIDSFINLDQDAWDIFGHLQLVSWKKILLSSIDSILKDWLKKKYSFSAKANYLGFFFGKMPNLQGCGDQITT